MQIAGRVAEHLYLRPVAGSAVGDVAAAQRLRPEIGGGIEVVGLVRSR